MMGPGLHPSVDQKFSWTQLKSDSRAWMKTTGISMRQSAKGFAAFSSMYSLSDCWLEKSRGKHDVYNAITAGGIAGAVCALRSG